jgi:threonine synthase
MDERNERAHTVASAIEINRPVNLKKCLRALEATIELEVLIALLPVEKSRQLARRQVKVSHLRAKEFREPAEKVKES